MAGPKRGGRTVRPPAVAGTFYPADAHACRALAETYVEDGAGRFAGTRENWIGGIVPHAGWVCSGAIAGQTVAALVAAPRARPVDVVVIFGAVHSPAPLDVAALDAHAAWGVPGGELGLSGDLERRLTELSSNLFRIDERFHRREHAVEVELPLVQVAWPDARILPVEVPLIDEAEQIGVAAARTAQQAGLSAVYLASTDLTHYGPAYDFAPAGVGERALDWARDNDRHLLQIVTEMRVAQVVPVVRARQNACGGGAIAAMMAASREHGATAGTVLRHANSFETLASVAPHHGPDNAVGYASVVVG